MAFRHVFSVGNLAKRIADTQAQKSFSRMVYTTAKGKANKKIQVKK